MIPRTPGIPEFMEALLGEPLSTPTRQIKLRDREERPAGFSKARREANAAQKVGRTRKRKRHGR